MTKDYAAMPPNTIRRADRAVEDETWIRQFLTCAAVGSLATVNEGHPFINTNLFFYDADRHCIYLHTARVGRARANVDTDNLACFSIMEMGRLLPAEEALEFSVEYAGVTVFGQITVVENEDEATAALQGLLDKYAPHLKPGEHYRPTTLDELKRTAVFRLDIDSWSGKKKEVEADFPGAFRYEERAMITSNQRR